MSPSDKSAYLSKSLYMRGLQCHKSLYLDRRRPELRAAPSAELEALWKSGHAVGDFAHMLFPGGVVVPFDGLTKDEQLAKTREEIDRGTKAIYEASFSFNDVFVKADIIVRNRGCWDLYEVKSSTSVKEHHWDDVAVQYHVLSDPYDCDFMDFCWRHVPEYSVFSLRGRGIDPWELYRQGVIKLQDVPLDSLNLMQRMQTEYFLDRKSHADPARIREFLKKVRYPVCFLDFETFGSGIPLFDGTRPYQQVPFQYSLHRIDAEGAEVRHFEYLAHPGVDPRKEIAEKLAGEIPFGACVLVYNMAFEKRVLRELGEFLPKLRKRLNAVIEGMIDLMEPFKRRDIYHWRMNGSYSLKSVLPVLVPEMTYEDLAISDGAMASEAYFTMEEIADPAELSRLRAALLEYCRQDTLGLVRLLEKMRAMERADAEG